VVTVLRLANIDRTSFFVAKSGEKPPLAPQSR